MNGKEWSLIPGESGSGEGTLHLLANISLSDLLLPQPRSSSSVSGFRRGTFPSRKKTYISRPSDKTITSEGSSKIFCLKALMINRK